MATVVRLDDMFENVDRRRSEVFLLPDVVSSSLCFLFCVELLLLRLLCQQIVCSSDGYSLSSSQVISMTTSAAAMFSPSPSGILESPPRGRDAADGPESWCTCSFLVNCMTIISSPWSKPP